MKNTKTEKKVTILISVILTILLILGLTYAYFSAKSTTDTRSVVTGNLKITYEDGRMINAEKLIPMPEEYVDEEGTEISFTVKNSGSMSGYFNVGLIDVNIDEGLASEDFKWRLKSEDKVIINGTFKNIITDKVLQSGLEIGANETKNYKLQIWIQETDKDQTTMMNKVFKAKIDITGKNKLTDLAQNEPLVLTNTVEGDSLKNLKIYGNSEQRNIPKEYQEVEYIQNTAPNASSYGYQYIDTGFKPNQDTKVEMKVTFSGVMGAFFGARTSLGSKMFGSTLNGTVNMYRFDYGDIYTNLTYRDIESISKITADKNKIYFNDALVYEYTYTTFSCDYSLYLLATNNSNSPVAINNNGKLYYTKIWDNGVLVRDMVPCYRKADNEIGMYDKANNKFYKNAGTGTFLKGNDVVPTPENPVDVVSVGENSKNLFDINSQYIRRAGETGTVNIENSTISVTRTGVTPYIGFIVPTIIGETYTISYGDGDALVRIVEIDTPINVIGTNYGIDINSGSSFKSTKPYLLINIVGGNEGETKYRTNIQLEKGETATEYRPYNYVDITSSGKNLFDIDSFISLSRNSTYYRKEGNKLIQIAPDYRSDTDLPIVMTLQPGTYYMSGLLTGSKRKLINATIDRVINHYNGSFTITEPTEITFKSWYYANTEIGTLQIEEGKTSTNYEPYKEPITTTIDLTGHEPLRKIGDVADYIDYNKGKIVRNIGKIVFDGTEDFTYATTNPNGLARFRYYMPAEYNVSNSTNLLGLSSHFGYEVQGNASAVNKNKFFIQANAINLLFYGYLDINEYPTVEDFKEMVETKYNEGNPIKMYYQLATPIEEDIDLPDIKTLNGTTIISSNGNIKPFFEGKY